MRPTGAESLLKYVKFGLLKSIHSSSSCFALAGGNLHTVQYPKYHLFHIPTTTSTSTTTTTTDHSYIRMDCKDTKERNYHPQVKALCKKATCHDHSCHKTTNASLISSGEINLYLQSLETGYGTESRQGITTKPNAVNADKDYLIYTNLKKIFLHHKKQGREKVIDSIQKQQQQHILIL